MMTVAGSGARARKSGLGPAPPRKRSALANREAREFLRSADPVLAPMIDARPDFRPRVWLDALPPLDAFRTLVFQVAGQQLSVPSTRAIISRLQQRFGGQLPSPAELLAADPQLLRDSGFSGRKSRRCARWRKSSSTDA
jgi:3-methyladenine DNA glycosylase/8-oxoguanine DNA glycosylase